MTLKSQRNEEWFFRNDVISWSGHLARILFLWVVALHGHSSVPSCPMMEENCLHGWTYLSSSSGSFFSAICSQECLQVPTVPWHLWAHRQPSPVEVLPRCSCIPLRFQQVVKHLLTVAISGLNWAVLPRAQKSLSARILPTETEGIF